jgi:vanillate O-demethylase monooxygenase subunit
MATPPASVPDFRALRACWHPVGYAGEFGDGPRRVRLLGEEIVVWRDGAGAPHALRDLCIHRGTALSLGRVVGDRIMCPYHGWQYDSDGICKLIPQLEDPARIPSKARVEAYHAQERYGLMWVAMDAPRWELPDIPEFGSGEWVTVDTGPFAWNADASRQLENFTDFGHFPWVHPGLLGDPSRPVVPAHTVDVEDGYVLRYDIVRPEAPNSDEFPVFGNEVIENPERRSRYRLHLPYTILLRLGWGGQAGMVYFFASQPVDVERCIGYLVIGRNYDLDQSPQVLRDFEDTIFEQDRRVVESQRPEQVPFDLAAEMHLKFDAVAINYRKAMREQGLAKRPDARAAS